MEKFVVFLMFVNLHGMAGNPSTYSNNSSHCKAIELHHRKFLNCSDQRLSFIPRIGDGIQGLIFGYNNLSNVSRDTFANISNPKLLLELQLDNNQIRNISSDALNAFTNLEYLFLSENPIFYDNMKHLLGALSHLKYFSHLYMSGIRTIRIQKDIFSLMKENNIESLEAKYYDMAEVSLDTFLALSRLKILDLEDNGIENLTLFKFEYLHSFYLDHNRLNTLPDFSMNDNEDECFFPRLEVLDIQTNFIQELRSETFKCLQKLRYLKFGDNPVVKLPNNFLSNLPNLHSLSIRNLFGGRLTTEPFAFNSTSLAYLEIEHQGPAEEIFVSLNDTFGFLPRLESLHISTIGMMYLTGQQLIELFSPLTNLRYIDCYLCQISTDPKYIVGYMKNAKSINFQNNHITSISDETFKQNKLLRYLNLRLNAIGHIPESALPITLLTGLYLLDLSKNPFICDCDIEWFIAWMKTKQNKSTIARYPSEYICSKPVDKKNVQLSKISFNYRECHPWSIWIWVAIIVSPCVLLIGIVILILYRNRWNIKHYFFLLRRKQHYQRLPGDIMMYDVFVSYENTDSEWLKERLAPFLEDDVGLKLCIHERDFRAGTFIFDNIVTKMNTSKRIIVVLTNAYARSNWCMFELKVAHSNLIEHGKELAIILLEEICSRNVNSSLRVLLDTTTYIEWTDDEVGQELFWSRLKDFFPN